MEKFKSLLHEQRFNFANTVRILCVIGLAVGLYLCVFYSVPMQQQKYADAADAFMSDQGVVLYDLALQRYQEEEFADTIEVAEKAYNACISKEGIVDPDRVLLAANIKFLAGNAMVKAKQLKNAVDAYKQSLRLNPNNFEAKYNLEWLQQMNGGAGPGGGAEDPANGKGGGNKKSI